MFKVLSCMRLKKALGKRNGNAPIVDQQRRISPLVVSGEMKMVRNSRQVISATGRAGKLLCV